MVVNEAMLCGCPVAVSDRVGAKYDLIARARMAYVFPSGDVDALAAILRDALSDPEKRSRMGEAARLRMETWSPREYVNALYEAVELIAGCAGRENITTATAQRPVQAERTVTKVVIEMLTPITETCTPRIALSRNTSL